MFGYISGAFRQQPIVPASIPEGIPLNSSSDFPTTASTPAAAIEDRPLTASPHRVHFGGVTTMPESNGVSSATMTEEKPSITRSSLILKRDATGSAKRNHEQLMGDSSPIVTVPRKRPTFYIEIIKKEGPKTPLKKRSTAKTTVGLGFEALKARRVEASGAGQGVRNGGEGKERKESKLQQNGMLLHEEEEQKIAEEELLDSDGSGEESDEGQEEESEDENEDEDEMEDGDEREDEDEGDDDAEDYMVPPDIVDKLKSEVNTQSFTRMGFPVVEGETRPSIGVGEVVAFRSRKVGENVGSEIWLAAIRGFRCFKEEVKCTLPEPNPDPSKCTPPKVLRKPSSYEADVTYISCNWLYSKAHFKELGANPKWGAKKMKYLGRRERVRTDHDEWRNSSHLLRDVRPIVLAFDDAYPATSSSHPLSILASVKLSKANPELPLPPNYFFGDDDIEESPAFNGAFYSRVCFRFNSLPMTAGELRSAFGAGDLNLKKTISFTPHSLSRTPYDPKTTQIYSPFSHEWYNTSDLRAKNFVSKSPEQQEMLSDGRPLLKEEDGTDFVPQFTSVNPRLRAHSPDIDGVSPIGNENKASIRGELRKLASRSIRRGGDYGLIGNSYLVVTARKVLAGIKDADGEDTANILIAADKDWWSRVEERSQTRGEDRRRGTPPAGTSWICPVTKRLI